MGCEERAHDLEMRDYIGPRRARNLHVCNDSLTQPSAFFRHSQVSAKSKVGSPLLHGARAIQPASECPRDASVKAYPQGAAGGAAADRVGALVPQGHATEKGVRRHDEQEGQEQLPPARLPPLTRRKKPKNKFTYPTARQLSPLSSFLFLSLDRVPVRSGRDSLLTNPKSRVLATFS